MKRKLKTGVLLLFFMIVPATHSQLQASQLPGPTITSANWQGEVRSGEEAWLEIIASDPHGVITEVQIDFGDGGVTFAHTHCVQGTEVGLPARLLIPYTYSEPGTYTVSIIALSAPTCKSRGGIRESDIVTLSTEVAKGKEPKDPGNGGGDGEF